MTNKPKPKRFKNLLSWYKNDATSESASGSGSGSRSGSGIRSETGSRNVDVDSVNDVMLEESPSIPQEESSFVECRNDRIGIENNFDITALERDLGIRRPICSYPQNLRDSIRRAYMVLGPYQPILASYPSSWDGVQGRKFCTKWYRSWQWLEYSVELDKTYCFPCFLFDSYPSHHPAFTEDGFNGWKNAKSKRSGFFHPVGLLNSPHNTCMHHWTVLRNPTRHIERVISTQSAREVADNRLRLISSIESARLLMCV